MQPLLKIKPPRLSYLLSLTVFALGIGALTSLVSIVLYRDDLHDFSASRGVITGLLLGVMLMWIYDEIKKFERWSVELTENSIIVPEVWFKRKAFLLSELDKHRTQAYNSEKNLRNRTRYTFWAINGTFIVIGKSFYGKSQINSLLEKIGLEKTGSV
jgi:hypothetical protein